MINERPTDFPKMPLMANGHKLSRTNEVEVASLEFGVPLIFGCYDTCAVCDERPKYQVVDGTVHVQNPCPLPDGVTTEIILNVPSGRIVVCDDLRPVYNWDDHGMASYNTALGQAQAVQAMAALGCAFGPVGNSCPSLYRATEDSYIIASERYDDDDNPSLPEDQKLAGIITDLWAYSIADLEDWKSRGGHPELLTGSRASVVDVRPGRYRFRHHSGEAGFDEVDIAARRGDRKAVVEHPDVVESGCGGACFPCTRMPAPISIRNPKQWTRSRE